MEGPIPVDRPVPPFARKIAKHPRILHREGKESPMKKLFAIALGVALSALTPAAMAEGPQTTCQPTQTLSADCGQGGCDESLTIGERVWFSYGRNFWNI